MNRINVDGAILTPEIIEVIIALQLEYSGILKENMEAIVNTTSFLIRMSDQVENLNEEILNHCKRLDFIRNQLAVFQTPKSES